MAKATPEATTLMRKLLEQLEAGNSISQDSFKLLGRLIWTKPEPITDDQWARLANILIRFKNNPEGMTGDYVKEIEAVFNG